LKSDDYDITPAGGVRFYSGGVAMGIRWGLGPVFAYECLTVSRRWQLYAGRALLVASLLAGLTLVWLAKVRARQFTSHQQLAEIGSVFESAIMAVELVLALVVVPAATAGAVCQDKMRGGLTLMMVTDLSDAEIVLGKLASRLAAVLGVMACGLPVLAISTSLGGVDPLSTFGGSLVILGVAILGVSVSLTYSVWATRPHEALMATYATYAVWLLALIAWSETSHRTTPGLLYVTNPFWLLFGDRWFNPAASSPVLYPAGFLAGSLAVSAVLAAVSVWRVRAVALRQSGRPARPISARRGTFEAVLGRLGLPDDSLDGNPVLWREQHRRQPSGWGRAIWRLYAVLSVLFILLAVFVNDQIAAGVGGFMVAIGLLMISVTSATALAEERAHGSLDVLMATPLSTREIVLGKWWGAYRAVLRLAVLPGLLGLSVALMRGKLAVAIPLAVLVSASVLAYGAVVTSLGLWLATRQPRLSRAVGLCVAAYLAATVVWPTIVIVTSQPRPDHFGLLWVSPFFAVYSAMWWVCWGNADFASWLFASCASIGITATVAYALLRYTLHSFDRLLGRIPDRPVRFPRPPRPRSVLREPVGTASGLN
jgi:ABC-type transport system involved in multi-copper enzyme maturation permease subunit